MTYIYTPAGASLQLVRYYSPASKGTTLEKNIFTPSLVISL